MTRTRAARLSSRLLAALATVLAAAPSRGEGTRSFEITASLGQDATAVGSDTTTRHPIFGVSVAYLYAAHPDSAGGIFASATLAYAHTTSDGNALTAGTVGLDAYLMPAVAFGWRRHGIRAGVIADYRLDVAFIDTTPQQALVGSYPGYLTGFFIGPLVSVPLGRSGSAAARFRIELRYEWGAGTRINATSPDGLVRTVDLQRAHDATARLSYMATSHLVLGASYWHAVYPAAVSLPNSSISRPFDQRHRALLLTVGIVSR